MVIAILHRVLQHARHRARSVTTIAAHIAAMVVVSAPCAVRLGAQSPANQQGEWLRSLARLEEFTASRYANFDWKVRHGVDPAALHARADSSLRRAGSERAARAALIAFVDAFHDGHFTARPIPASAETGTDDPEAWPASDAAARTICRAFGYRAEGSRTMFARLDGWREVSLPRLPFAAGTITRRGTVFGVLRIHSFGYEPHGWACEMAWPSVRKQFTDARCDARCESVLRRAVADTLASALAEAVRTLMREGPAAIIFDVTGNGGGTEWVSKAVRAVTARPIPAQPVAFIRNDFHRRAIERTLARVDSALPSTPPGAWRDTLTVARDRLAAAARIANTPCDRLMVWRDGAAGLRCDGLITGLWTAGPVPSLSPDLAPRGDLSLAINSLAHSSTVTAGWSGRVVLVTDRASASATEQFVAELADGAGAWVVGERTYGSGCGYTRGAEHLDLPEVGLRVRAPDCARIRPDGTNEVAGIAPTHDIGWTGRDGAVVRAEKVIIFLLR